MESKKDFKLPTGLIGKIELSRLLRELSILDDFFISARVRQVGTPIQPPKVTEILSNLAKLNGLNLLENSARAELRSNLDLIDKNAPQLHISFAVEPTNQAIEQLTNWFRANIHPYALLQVGLQPRIAIGCVLRTPNKFFDMSLRIYLEKQENYLAQLVSGAAPQ
ncbi:MAG TPA: hypothetical protein VLE51_01175 [Candidatus Saccharimonadales bacterium]|nr:hypothetical protein [Candidatus Saccharimonadales bacterium]